MSNAYTHGVQSGKVTTLKEYVSICAAARAIYTDYKRPLYTDYKEDPVNVPRPQSIPLDPYQAELVAQTKDELFFWKNITPEELGNIMRHEKNEMAISEYESAVRQKAYRENYENMMAQVENWNVPSEEHEEFKAFMMQELKDAMSFDVHSNYSDFDIEELKNAILSDNEHYHPDEMKEFRAEKIEYVQRQIEIREKEYKRQVEENAKKNKWLELFYDSFEKM